MDSQTGGVNSCLRDCKAEQSKNNNDIWVWFGKGESKSLSN
jgi:hypothetical protein